MARIVNEAAHAARRNAILDATQGMIERKGYEQMAIADILGELRISSGAFYHYFDSKPALLAALVERTAERVAQLVLPILEDRESGAIDKLRRLFAVLDHWKVNHKRFIFAYMRTWYSDDNAIVRYKIYVARIKWLSPIFTAIFDQGVEEGVFDTPYPDQAARMVLSLLEDIGRATVDLLLSTERKPDDLAQLVRIISATLDSLERLLGAPTGCLQSFSEEELAAWLPPSLLAEE